MPKVIVQKKYSRVQYGTVQYRTEHSKNILYWALKIFLWALSRDSASLFGVAIEKKG